MTRTFLLPLLAAAVCLLGAVACSASQNQSGHRSGKLGFVGELPSQTQFLKWTAMLEVHDETWCVSDVQIGDEVFVSSSESVCNARVQSSITPTSVLLGEFSYGRVFVFLAPGRRAVGNELGSSAGGDASASLSYSQSGDLIVVVVESSGSADGGQAVILRDDQGNQVIVPLG